MMGAQPVATPLIALVQQGQSAQAAAAAPGEASWGAPLLEELLAPALHVLLGVAGAGQQQPQAGLWSQVQQGHQAQRAQLALRQALPCHRSRQRGIKDWRDKERPGPVSSRAQQSTAGHVLIVRWCVHWICWGWLARASPAAHAVRGGAHLKGGAPAPAAAAAAAAAAAGQRPAARCKARSVCSAATRTGSFTESGHPDAWKLSTHGGRGVWGHLWGPACPRSGPRPACTARAALAAAQRWARCPQACKQTGPSSCQATGDKSSL